MAGFDTAQQIAEQYPYFGFLMSDPEVGPLLTRAVDPSQPYSSNKFQAELMKTNYFRSRSAATRQWEILVNTDPAEAWRRRAETYFQQSDIAHKLGYMLTEPELQFMAEWNLGRGIEVGSPEWNWGLRTILNTQTEPHKLVNGSIMGAMNQIHDTAKGDWLMSMSQEEYYRMGVDVAMGYLDDKAVRYALQERASSLYPHLRPQMDQGATMKDLFSGHMQTIAEEWEVDPGTLTYDSPTMQSIIGRRDPNTGNMRSASLYEAKILARQDDKFWNTSRARQLESSAGNYLLKTFGKVA
jgi:hypothetical protein